MTMHLLARFRRLPPGARDRSHAQSLVEFALTAPLFVVLVFGMLQLAVWIRCAGVAQLAAREAAATASGAYLAQYRNGTRTEALGASESAALWSAAEMTGIERGQAVLATTATGKPGPFVWLTLDEAGMAPGQDGAPTIRARIAIALPILGLSFLPGIPYVTQETVRPDRFYS